MSDNKDKHDKPDQKEIDPEATVTFQRSSLTAPPEDDDATVSIQRSRLTEAPPVDEDATVMMKPVKDAPAVDEDATVMMAPIRAADAPGAKVSAGGEPEFDPDATNIAPIAPPPPPLASPPAPVVASAPAAESAPAAPASTIPWNAIAGGVVVLLVVLYFVFSGDKGKPPVPKADVAATQAPAPAATPAAPAAETPAAPAVTAPATPAAPAASVPATASAPAAAAPEKAATPAASGSVKSLLSAQLKRGLVAVSEAGGVTTVTLRDARQFDAGGADPDARLVPVLQEVASALDRVPGAIVVTGHADTSPSTDKRYPTNKELSAARAAAAAKAMAAKLRDPSRLTSEGASDTQPLVPNDSAVNRAKNRRVVIVLKPAA